MANNCFICNKSMFTIGVCKECKNAILKIKTYKADSDEFKQAREYLEPFLEDERDWNPEKEAARKAVKQQEKSLEARHLLEEQKANVGNILELITTADTLHGYRIISQNGLVYGFSAIGTGALSELKAGLADILGSNATVFSERMKRAFDGAVSQMYQEAAMRGCNAVVATKTSDFSIADNMICAVVCGTAVRVMKE